VPTPRIEQLSDELRPIRYEDCVQTEPARRQSQSSHARRDMLTLRSSVLA